MSNYIITNGELYHHGVKGMKWGVRRYQKPDGSLTPAGIKRYAKKGYAEDSRNSNENITSAKFHRAYAKKAYSAASNHERRLRAEQYTVSEAERKSRKEQNDAIDKQRIGQAVINGRNAAAKVLGNVGAFLVFDQIALKGAGRKQAASAIKYIGRAAISAYTYARGGRDIKWYDN